MIFFSFILCKFLLFGLFTLLFWFSEWSVLFGSWYCCLIRFPITLVCYLVHRFWFSVDVPCIWFFLLIRSLSCYLSLPVHFSIIQLFYTFFCLFAYTFFPIIFGFGLLLLNILRHTSYLYLSLSWECQNYWLQYIFHQPQTRSRARTITGIWTRTNKKTRTELSTVMIAPPKFVTLFSCVFFLGYQRGVCFPFVLILRPRVLGEVLVIHWFRKRIGSLPPPVYIGSLSLALRSSVRVPRFWRPQFYSQRITAIVRCNNDSKPDDITSLWIRTHSYLFLRYLA